MKRREAANDAIWGLGDQAFSSLTNFVLSVAVARNVTTEEFGAFTLAFATFSIVLTISRALTTDPLTIRYSATARDDWRAATALATGAALAVGVIAGVVAAIIGVFVGGTVGLVLIVLGASFPGLLVQDSWRFAFFAGQRGRSAMANDMVWAVVLFALLGLSEFTGLSVVGAVLIWSVGALVAALYGMRQARVVPDPRRPLHWWREHWDLIPRLTAEAVALSASTPLTLFAITGIVGVAAAGVIRGAQVLLNAVNVLNQGIRMSSVPTAARLATSSRRRMLEFCVLVAGGLGLACLAWTGILLLIPEHWGEALLGETWESSRDVILPLGLMAASQGIQAGAGVGLRALGVVRRSLTSRLMSVTCVVGGGAIGAVVGGAVGASWGMLCGSLLGTTAWWWQFLSNERDHRRTEPEEPDTVLDALSDPSLDPEL